MPGDNNDRIKRMMAWVVNRKVKELDLVGVLKTHE
jgi:hypothetical protein